MEFLCILIFTDILEEKIHSYMAQIILYQVQTITNAEYFLKLLKNMIQNLDFIAALLIYQRKRKQQLEL